MSDSIDGPKDRQSTPQHLSPAHLPGDAGTGGVSRLPRLLKIIETLQSGKTYSSQALADLCGVSRRTIFRDIAALQLSGLRVALDESGNGYYLPNRITFALDELSIPEALSLLLLTQELGGTEHGVPFQAAARTAAEKICRNLPPHVRDLVRELTERVSVEMEPHHGHAESQENYDLVLKALIERRQLRIDYDAASAEGKQSTVVDVYRFLFRRRAWYVIGRSSLHREVRVFHLGRILRAELWDSRYEIPTQFTLDRFLGNAWHLIRDPRGSTRVVIRFHAQVARNVAEVQWHKTQAVTWLGDGRLEFRVNVDGLEEISWWILGYGDRAEVLEPPELRDKLAAHARNMLQCYATAPEQTAGD